MLVPKKTAFLFFLMFSLSPIFLGNVAARETNPFSSLGREIEATRRGTPKYASGSTEATRGAKPFNKHAVVRGATLVSKNGTTLTISKDSKTLTVLTDAQTLLRRRFWGKATLEEMQINDELNVVGTWTDQTKTSIKARLVRDLSIQKRNGVFFGTVSSLSSSGWVMQTVNRGNQTVTVSTLTKFINRKEQTISQADIVVGHRVRVKGLWDNKNKTITEVVQVKDFSLPPRTVTPTP